MLDYLFGFLIKFLFLLDLSCNIGEMFLIGNLNVKESDIIGCFKRRDKIFDKLMFFEYVLFLKLMLCK